MAITYPASVGLNSANAQTGFTLTIPSGTVTNDILIGIIVGVNSVGSFLVSDNDTGGNAWALLQGGNNGTSITEVYWKRATSGTASKTWTVDDNASDATTSIAGAILVCRGCIASGNPYGSGSYESNASGNEAHAGFTPGQANSGICLVVANATNDLDATSLATATNPGALTTGAVAGTSRGGTDCWVEIGAANQVGAAAATGNFTWAQTNAASMSIVFALVPAIAAFTLDASIGAHTITGLAASLEYGREVAAVAGSYALTGTAASLEFGRALTATIGAYSLSGQTASLEYNRIFGVDAGSYAVTGQAVGLSRGRTLDAEAGTLTITGFATSLELGRLIPATAGSYAITGTAASLELGRRTPADSGVYDLSGQVVALLFGREVAANIGSYAISGTAASLEFNRRLVSSIGSYGITGQSASLEYGRVLSAGAGSYTITGQAATLTHDTGAGANSGGDWVVVGRRRRVLLLR